MNGLTLNMTNEKRAAELAGQTWVDDRQQMNASDVTQFLEGDRVIAGDRGNIGTVVQDDGGHSVTVTFVAKDGNTATKLLPRNELKSVDDANAKKIPKVFEVKSAWDAVEHPAKLRQCVIEGLARRGEVVNAVAATKVGKSWLALGLLFAVSTGRDWLNRRVLKGNVLLLDNELHDETIQDRMSKVAGELKLQPSKEHSRFDYVVLRGESVNIVEITDILSKYQPGDLTLVVLDAKYRFFSDGKQENSNDDQTEFHNAVDRLAIKLDCVIVLVHHSTKGDQGGKGVTDVGSGGGSQARAVDCHLVIRPHAEPGLAVLDAAVRTFAPVEPQTIRWDFPLWSVADGVQPILKQERTRSDSKQEANDNAGIDELRKILEASDFPLSRNAMHKAFGGGKERLNRLIRIGIEKGVFQPAGSKKAQNGEIAELFTLAVEEGSDVQQSVLNGLTV